jgi:tetratricopeptide (TPR) repeat protein
MYINKAEAYKAIEYNRRSIELLNSYSDTIPFKETILHSLTRRMTFFGQIYARLGRYKDAMKFYKEAIKILPEQYQKHLLKAWHSSLIGEVYLREGRLSKATKEFSKTLEGRREIPGKVGRILYTMILDVEAKIRLGQINEAEKECEEVLKINTSIINNYERLMYITCFYHMAIIKYKQGEIESSLSSFNQFFAHIK